MIKSENKEVITTVLRAGDSPGRTVLGVTGTHLPTSLLHQDVSLWFYFAVIDEQFKFIRRPIVPVGVTSCKSRGRTVQRLLE